MASSTSSSSSGGIGFGGILLIVAGVALVGGGLYFVFGRSGSPAPSAPEGRPRRPASAQSYFSVDKKAMTLARSSAFFRPMKIILVPGTLALGSDR